MKMSQFVKGCANRSYELSTRNISLDERGAVVAPVTVMRMDMHGHLQVYKSVEPNIQKYI